MERKLIALNPTKVFPEPRLIISRVGSATNYESTKLARKKMEKNRKRTFPEPRNPVITVAGTRSSRPRADGTDSSAESGLGTEPVKTVLDAAVPKLPPS